MEPVCGCCHDILPVGAGIVIVCFDRFPVLGWTSYHPLLAQHLPPVPSLSCLPSLPPTFPPSLPPSLPFRSGQVDQPRMKVAGCGIEELLRHYVMVTEFCWVKLYPDEVGREGGKKGGKDNFRRE